MSSITQDISNAVNSSRLKYHERLALKLNEPKTVPKTYREILKAFANGTKIPLIFPLLIRNQLLKKIFDKSRFF